jgi:hypothetical protein
MGSLPSTEIFRDYKLFGEVKQATTIVVRVLGIEQVVHIDTCVYNTVAGNAFDPPPAIKALIKSPGGFAPADPPTRSLAGTPRSPLRSRGSLRSLFLQ